MLKLSDVLMYYSPVGAGKSMSMLLQPQDSHTLSAERNSAPSSPRSTSSTRSPQNWYHRTSNRSVPDLVVGRHPHRLRSISSIKELAKKTSRSIFDQTFIDHHSFSNNQTDLNQRHVFVAHLPGSPKGPRCRPPTLVKQDSTDSSLDSLTPDQSGISNESRGPITPPGSQAVQSILVHRKVSQCQDMGNVDSKLGGIKVGRALLNVKKSRQTIERENSTTPTLVPERASEQPTQLATEQAAGETKERGEEYGKEEIKEQAKENVDPLGPPPVLRHRASSGQVQVPRRRSSLTAIHLDSSHFEKPSSSKNSDQGNRTSSFSASFHPVISSSNVTAVVLSRNPQEADKLGRKPFPHPLIPSSSNDQGLFASSSIPLSITPKHTHIYFPQTWPNGAPELKPAPLTPNHYECYRLHQPIRREKAMFNQVPCMTCGIHDKQQRYSCTWCELRVCERCMRQLDSIRRRPLTNLIEWVAKMKEEALARQSKELLKKGNDDKILKQGQSDEIWKKVDCTERAESKAKSDETVKKIESVEQSRSLSRNKDTSKDTDKANQLIKKAQGELNLVRKAEPSKDAASLAKQSDPAEKAERPAEETTPAERSAGEQAVNLQGGNMKEIMGSSFRNAHGKKSWGRAKADQMLRNSRG